MIIYEQSNLLSDVNLCKDHRGQPVGELVGTTLHNYVCYVYLFKGITYHFKFGIHNGEVYCSVRDYSDSKNFYKAKDIPIQLSYDLNKLFQNYLTTYKIDLRNCKINSILNL